MPDSLYVALKLAAVLATGAVIYYMLTLFARTGWH